MAEHILYLQDTYADTLLVLGICAAYNVQPLRYSGTAFVLPESASAPNQFPETSPDAAEPPYLYHRFMDIAVTSLGGGGMLNLLREYWNTTMPQYDEVMAMVSPLIPEPKSWKATRFYQVEKRFTHSAAFRPHQAKGANDSKARFSDGVNLAEFWLVDALRAFGFLLYASAKKLQREAPSCRWLVFVPCWPTYAFQDAMLHQPDLEVGVRYQAMAHLIGSELSIPHLFSTQYAELNPLARTPFKFFTLSPLNLTFSQANSLKKLVYELRQFSRPEQSEMTAKLLAVIENKNTDALWKFVHKFNTQIVDGAYINTEQITDLLLAETLWQIRLAAQ